ncbi:MAG: hypothetical protein AAFY64_09955 [Pseudomonadota bacterium]
MLEAVMVGLLLVASCGIAVFARLGMRGSSIRRGGAPPEAALKRGPVDHGSYRHGGGGWFVD